MTAGCSTSTTADTAGLESAGGSPPARGELAATSTPDGSAPAATQVPWQRLDLRMVWVNTAKFVLALIPGGLGLFVFPGSPLWPLLVASAVGVMSTAVDFKRWLKTRYRITDEHVERRTGWLVRKYRHVPRDRIRSVDTSAKLRHRIARLRVVHIGSGEARLSATFKLDALSIDKAEELRRKLVPDRRDEPAEQEIVISRVRWHWVFYNIFHIWAFLAAALFLNTSYWLLQSFGIDLLAVVDHLIGWADVGVGWVIALGVIATFALGFTGLALDFIAKYWNFELVRTTAKGGALLTRQGLFTTQTVYREDRRIRGIHIHEPLLWRWMGLTETRVVTTGIHAAREESANILPRAPISEAKKAATFVLPDGFLPLEAPLLRHPRSALVRRLLWASYGPTAVAGISAWLGAIGAVPDWVWPIPLATLPVTWALAVVAYVALGHTLVGPYLVVRSGALGRSTVALQRRAVIGWTLRQSIFQRLWGRMTIGISTAAGNRHYQAPDAGTDQALVFIKSATPWLADEFIEGGSDAAH